MKMKTGLSCGGYDVCDASGVLLLLCCSGKPLTRTEQSRAEQGDVLALTGKCVKNSAGFFVILQHEN